MFDTLNITKDYVIAASFEETLSKLDTIISTNFNNSQYSTFGNFVSTDPPEFVFMAKWTSIGRPILAEISSTKVYAKLYKLEDKSKIIITTKSNLSIILCFILLILVILISLFVYKTTADLKSSAICFLFALGLLLLDRFIKNMVIASFETDMKLKDAN